MIFENFRYSFHEKVEKTKKFSTSIYFSFFSSIQQSYFFNTNQHKPITTTMNLYLSLVVVMAFLMTAASQAVPPPAFAPAAVPTSSFWTGTITTHFVRYDGYLSHAV